MNAFHVSEFPFGTPTMLKNKCACPGARDEKNNNNSCISQSTRQIAANNNGLAMAKANNHQAKGEKCACKRLECENEMPFLSLARIFWRWAANKSLNNKIKASFGWSCTLISFWALYFVPQKNERSRVSTICSLFVFVHRLCALCALWQIIIMDFGKKFQ